MLTRLLLLVAVLTCALLPYSSMAIKPRKVHVHLEGNRRRCFMEEMTAGTVLMIEFNSELLNAQTHQVLTNPYSLLITVEDPDGNTITRIDSKPTNRVFVTAAKTGEHFVCFAVKQYIPNSYCRLFPEVYLGDPGDPRITSPVEAQLHELGYAVAANNDLVGEIREEQKLARERERLFRNMSAKLSSRVYWLAGIQIVILALTAAWQMRYLKRFFQAKKLV